MSQTPIKPEYKQPWRERLAPWFFVSPSLVLLLAIGLFPVIYTGYYSTFNWTMGFGTPSFAGFGNYVQALTSSDFGWSVLRTLILLAITLPIELVLGLVIAFALDSAHNVWLRRALQVCLVIPIAITPAVIGLLAQLMFNQQFGIINYLIGLIGIAPVDWLGGSVSAFATVVAVHIWEWTPFVALVLSASLSTVPTDIEEAVMLETDRWWPRFKSVILPYMWPGITAALVFQTAFTIKSFGMIYSIAQGGPGTSTMFAMLQIERTAFRGFNIGLASAESILMLIMSIVLARIYIRLFYTDKDD
ncbi:carbohydrate ABC transporter permease [Salinisphaera hydrothermalis]|uniref:Putative ABC transporter permease n=1 Tax=Salinisphaera hydrothermalis (strain C41B8) TaxID=1304275 RepID=A0A084IIL9_SALHC|nr:sugar ABC transporter permease [Salinisphaera hydrothermalis]KEZ76553.1 putative ABC transporter permease [Salinisphaera hydrothermalis C41B8]